MTMTRLLYEIEDYLEDAAEAERLPHWLRHLLDAVGRTIGETADIVARHLAR
ncbi:MAG: hypothetical protein WDN31_10590 [Hyphomicrobium sp.]